MFIGTNFTEIKQPQIFLKCFEIIFIHIVTLDYRLHIYSIQDKSSTGRPTSVYSRGFFLSAKLGGRSIASGPPDQLPSSTAHPN